MIGFDKQLSKHKWMEASLYIGNNYWFIFTLSLAKKGDHHGFNFEIGILTLTFNLEIYDCRHWNYKENRFYLSGEE